MFNSLLSKASRGTNEFSDKEGDKTEELNASATFTAKKARNEATGTYPSPGSSPYHLEDDDDTLVLLVRSPSNSQLPRVVDGSLTYDNLKTSPSDEEGTKDSLDTKTNDGDNVTNKRFDDKTLASKLFADSVIVEPIPNETEVIVEDKDPLVLSLHASDLDISAINDITLTTPIVSKTSPVDGETDKKSSEIDEKTKSGNNKLEAGPKDDNPSKKDRLHEHLSRRMLLLLTVFGTCLAIYGSRCVRRGMAPVSSPPRVPDTHAKLSGQTDPLKITSTNGSEITTDVAFRAGNTTLLAEVAEVVNTSNVLEKATHDTPGPISVSLASGDRPTIKMTTAMDTTRLSPKFPSLQEDGSSFCHGSRWRIGMTMPQLVCAGILLLATTSRFGSSRPKPVDEFSLSPQAKKELESYDLSKYLNAHSFAELREKLRARKCNTVGKKPKLAHRLAAVYKAELETLTVAQLRKILKSKNFTQYGTKTEIIRVLVEECP